MQGYTACGCLVVKFAGAHAYSNITDHAQQGRQQQNFASESVISADIRNVQHNLPIICFQLVSH